MHGKIAVVNSSSGIERIRSRGYLRQIRGGGKKNRKKKGKMQESAGGVARVRSRSPFVRSSARPRVERNPRWLARSSRLERARTRVGSSQQPLAYFPFDDWRTPSSAHVTPSTGARRHRSRRSPRPIFASAARRCGRLVLSIDESYVEGLAAGARRS